MFIHWLREVDGPKCVGNGPQPAAARKVPSRCARRHLRSLGCLEPTTSQLGALTPGYAAAVQDNPAYPYDSDEERTDCAAAAQRQARRRRFQTGGCEAHAARGWRIRRSRCWAPMVTDPRPRYGPGDVFAEMVGVDLDDFLTLAWVFGNLAKNEGQVGFRLDLLTETGAGSTLGAFGSGEEPFRVRWRCPTSGSVVVTAWLRFCGPQVSGEVLEYRQRDLGHTAPKLRVMRASIASPAPAGPRTCVIRPLSLVLAYTNPLQAREPRRR
jgi:hypothetical protein